MSQESNLVLALGKRPVTLHYPGAEGVVFHDAVFTLRNAGQRTADRPKLQIKIAQAGRVLVESAVDLSGFDVSPTLKPGDETRFSLFRLMQKHVVGFGSKVNMFGYKAALNWSYQVSAAPLTVSETAPFPSPQTWDVRWHPSETDSNLVEVEIS
jgi:hypothetical protein